MVKDSVDLLELLRKRGIEGDLLASARACLARLPFSWPAVASSARSMAVRPRLSS